MRKVYFLFIVIQIIFSCINNEEDNDLKVENSHEYPQVYNGYSDVKHRDFTMRVNNKSVNTISCKTAIDYIKGQIDFIYTILDNAVINDICCNPIWVEKDVLSNGGAWYHISVDWLIQNGMNPDKAKCIEIVNYKNFLDWAILNQPFELFHEYCHLYHDQVLSLDYEPIINAYNNALQKGLYRNVSYHAGNGEYRTIDRAYALTNHHEYFAELSEAYYGMNDYFPHYYKELKEYDPEGFKVLEKIWGNIN
jgi:hypothetical protein